MGTGFTPWGHPGERSRTPSPGVSSPCRGVLRGSHTNSGARRWGAGGGQGRQLQTLLLGPCSPLRPEAQGPRPASGSGVQQQRRQAGSHNKHLNSGQEGQKGPFQGEGEPESKLLQAFHGVPKMTTFEHLPCADPVLRAAGTMMNEQDKLGSALREASWGRPTTASQGQVCDYLWR